MLQIRKRHQYALRAVFELARRYGQGPIKISAIAAAQQIPARFLEVILGQLKGSGMVASKRGFNGGYLLTAAPAEITVGKIFRYMHTRRNSPAESPGAAKDCSRCRNGSLAVLWSRVQEAVGEIYDSTTLQDLLDNDRTTAKTCAFQSAAGSDSEAGPAAGFRSVSSRISRAVPEASNAATKDRCEWNEK